MSSAARGTQHDMKAQTLFTEDADVVDRKIGEDPAGHALDAARSRAGVQ